MYRPRKFNFVFYMIKKILYIVNLFFVLLLLGVYVGVRVSPEFISELSLFSYIYPLLLVVNICFCLFWSKRGQIGTYLKVNALPDNAYDSVFPFIIAVGPQAPYTHSYACP